MEYSGSGAVFSPRGEATDRREYQISPRVSGKRIVSGRRAGVRAENRETFWFSVFLRAARQVAEIRMGNKSPIMPIRALVVRSAGMIGQNSVEIVSGSLLPPPSVAVIVNACWEYSCCAWAYETGLRQVGVVGFIAVVGDAHRICAAFLVGDHR